jgi:hypothetical protein
MLFAVAARDHPEAVEMSGTNDIEEFLTIVGDCRVPEKLTPLLPGSAFKDSIGT